MKPACVQIWTHVHLVKFVLKKNKWNQPASPYFRSRKHIKSSGWKVSSSFVRRMTTSMSDALYDWLISRYLQSCCKKNPTSSWRQRGDSHSIQNKWQPNIQYNIQRYGLTKSRQPRLWSIQDYPKSSCWYPTKLSDFFRRVKGILTPSKRKLSLSTA